MDSFLKKKQLQLNTRTSTYRIVHTSLHISETRATVLVLEKNFRTNSVICIHMTRFTRHALSALNISTGPLARRTFQTAGPVRASTFYLSLARTGHLDICWAIRFQIVLARTTTNHSMYFSRGHPPHISAVFAQSFCYSEAPVWRESESGMSIKHTDVSV